MSAFIPKVNCIIERPQWFVKGQKGRFRNKLTRNLPYTTLDFLCVICYIWYVYQLKNETGFPMMRKDGVETKRKILNICVRLLLNQGYKNTTITQITREANVTRGSFQNLFPTKDAVLLELVESMFNGQFNIAKGIVVGDCPPVYVYAVETAIQLALTEMNENLREIYIEAYTLPATLEYIHQHTTAELARIFGSNLPGCTQSDFYEMEVGTAGLMRGYMAKKCDIYFPLEHKLRCFLTEAMRVYKVPEAEQAEALAFVAGLDIKSVAEQVLKKLFAVLEMKFDFKLSKDSETEERK